jgi:hypothetical protein
MMACNPRKTRLFRATLHHHFTITSTAAKRAALSSEHRASGVPDDGL